MCSLVRDWEFRLIVMRDTKYVILEGISGCGKSKLFHPVSALSNYRDIIQMRYAPSMWVYNRLYRRKEYDYEHMNQMLDKLQDACIVWMLVDPDEAYRRKRVKGDSHKIENLYESHELYTYYFDKICTMSKVHRVDTTNKIPEEVLLEIERRVYV